MLRNITANEPWTNYVNYEYKYLIKMNNQIFKIIITRIRPRLACVGCKTVKHIKSKLLGGWPLWIFEISQIILHLSVNQHNKFMTSK